MLTATKDKRGDEKLLEIKLEPSYFTLLAWRLF